MNLTSIKMKRIILLLLFLGLVICSCSNRDKTKTDCTQNKKTVASGVESVEKNDWHTFDELLEQNIALSFEKQLLFEETIGSKSWMFDMKSGTITFGDSLSFPVQIIGSFSYINKTWMWGWANSESKLPKQLLKQSYQLKKLGKSKQIEELILGTFRVDQGFEHKIGMIACGLFNSKSYYCANYGDGTLVLTIDADNSSGIDKDYYTKILSTFPQLVKSMHFNHKKAFVNYLIDRDFKVKFKSNSVIGDRNGKQIIGNFDDNSRLIDIEGKI